MPLFTKTTSHMLHSLSNLDTNTKKENDENDSNKQEQAKIRLEQQIW